MRIKALLISMCAMIMLLGCGPSSEAGADTHRASTFWKKLQQDARAPGPYTYSSRNPIPLADGTHVVCVATSQALWCKEAASQ